MLAAVQHLDSTLRILSVPLHAEDERGIDTRLELRISLYA